MEIEAIYENIQGKNRNTLGHQTQSQNPSEARSSRRKGWFVPITACLGLICVLLAIALTLLYIHFSAERDQMNMKNMKIAEEYQESLNSLKINYSHLTEERDQLVISLMNLELETKVKDLSGYFISCEAKSWTDSRQFCRDRGEDLLIINTEEEQRYISSIVKERFWIGLSDIEKEGNMTWVDNTPLNKGFWNEGEPNDQNGNEDCVEIFILSQNTMNWNDLPCSEKRRWICETNKT